MLFACAGSPELQGFGIDPLMAQQIRTAPLLAQQIRNWIELGSV
jgi:hypothetical protein